ncbi:acyltransferase, partial [Verrucomicrobiales bacterium]|nr:acyltransferase [Verrucomicrobiales bacterium]
MSAIATQRPAHYRPDIDGLRALAVIPVLLFHLGLSCPGGYVGVDVFFVISGFLITSIILREIAAGTFTLSAFWVRRIRRILPALSVVILATIIGAGFVLYPEDYRLFGKEVISQAALVANFYFWQQDGYFDAPAEKLALLHTWSLAVEEQFYLLFPFVLGLL